MLLSFKDNLNSDKWTKWQDFWKYSYEQIALGYDIHRSLLINEVLVESDYPSYEDNWEASRLIGSILEHKGFKPSYYYSGNKSVHCLQNKERVIIKRDDGRIILTKLEEVHRMVQNNKNVLIKHKDQFIKVINTKKRALNVDERLIKIQTKDGNSLISSKDHLHLVMRDNKHQIVRADSITLKDRFIKDLNSFKGKEDVGTYNLGRFLGLYLAEGCSYEKSHQLSFTFDITEQKYVDFLIGFAKPLGAHCKYVLYKESNCIRLNIFSRALYSLVEEFLIGTVAKNKDFKSKVYGMAFKFREGIIDGWLEGDGDHNKYQNGTTISKGLAESMQRLGLTVGRYFTRKNYKYLVGDENRRKYRLRWIKNPKFEYKTTFPYAGNAINPPKGCVYLSITYINKQYIKKTSLIDIEVDSDDHLFTIAKGIVTHNCHVYFDFKCLLKLPLELQDEILQTFKWKRTFMKEFMAWLRMKMITCWGMNNREFDKDLAKAKHLIRSELSKNKQGYKTFLGYTYKDLPPVPYICNENNRIYPKIGSIRLSEPHNPTELITEFFKSRKDVKNKGKLKRREASLHNWLNGNNPRDVKDCVKHILSEEFTKAGDGHNRAMFILVNELRRCVGEDQARIMVNDWNVRMGEQVRETEINYRFKISKDYTISHSFVHQLLEELGVEHGCKHRT